MNNRILIIIAASTAVITTPFILMIVHWVSNRPLQRQIEAQNGVIVELAEIEKYRYEIRNYFEKGLKDFLAHFYKVKIYHF